MKAKVLVLTVMASVSISCGSSDSPVAGGTPTAEPLSPLVGRWQRLTTCQELVDALAEAGLGATAPAMVAGNGFVSGTPKQLAQSDDVCRGAVPREHSHFFTPYGEFGSLNWNDKQVDDGPYELVGTDTVRIGGVDFHYSITGDGQTLMLDPVVTPSAKREALQHPLEFSDAGWAVSVAFSGHTWERVDCEGWC